MRLALLHPHVAKRSCSECVKFMHDDSPQRMGLVVIRGGEKIERGAKNRPPCSWCPKIAPADDPKPWNAQEILPKNLHAYHHYLECRAVGSFPDDPIVRRNALLIRSVEDHVTETKSQSNASEALITLISKLRS